MPISNEDIMCALSHVSDAEQLKVTVKGSFFGSLLIGVVAMIFSLLLGPIGLLFGGIGGSIYAFKQANGKYKPLGSVIKELSTNDKALLYKDLAKIRSQITASDYVELILFLQGGGGILLKQQMFEIVRNFLKNTLNAQLNKY